MFNLMMVKKKTAYMLASRLIKCFKFYQFFFSTYLANIDQLTNKYYHFTFI